MPEEGFGVASCGAFFPSLLVQVPKQLADIFRLTIAHCPARAQIGTASLAPIARQSLVLRQRLYVEQRLDLCCIHLAALAGKTEPARLVQTVAGCGHLAPSQLLVNGHLLQTHYKVDMRESLLVAVVEHNGLVHAIGDMGALR